MNDEGAGVSRFLTAQDPIYTTVLTELASGRKRTHWMWFIFPQLMGLGHSATARHFGIRDFEEATQYLAHPILGPRLLQCAAILLRIDGCTARDIFGSPDDLKLASCMTLFGAVPGAPAVFAAILEKYFHGQRDERTIELLG